MLRVYTYETQGAQCDTCADIPYFLTLSLIHACRLNSCMLSKYHKIHCHHNSMPVVAIGVVHLVLELEVRCTEQDNRWLAQLA